MKNLKKRAAIGASIAILAFSSMNASAGFFCPKELCPDGDSIFCQCK